MGYVYDISSGGQNAVIDAFAEYQFDTADFHRAEEQEPIITYGG